MKCHHESEIRYSSRSFEQISDVQMRRERFRGRGLGVVTPLLSVPSDEPTEQTRRLTAHSLPPPLTNSCNPLESWIESSRDHKKNHNLRGTPQLPTKYGRLDLAKERGRRGSTGGEVPQRARCSGGKVPAADIYYLAARTLSDAVAKLHSTFLSSLAIFPVQGCRPTRQLPLLLPRRAMASPQPMLRLLTPTQTTTASPKLLKLT